MGVEPVIGEGGSDEAIRINPEDDTAYRSRGYAYRQLGQFERAIEDYDESIRLDPGQTEAYHNRNVTRSALEAKRALEWLFEE